MPDLLAGADSRLRVLLPTDTARLTALRAEFTRALAGGADFAARRRDLARLLGHLKRGLAVCRFRIGSTGKGNREPVWADVPFRYHRELPEGGLVKWAYLIRRRVATDDLWFVQFVVAVPGGYAREDAAPAGEVAVNPGWRALPGGLRVCTWRGSDGRQGTLEMPWPDVGRWQQAQELQSIRDLNFDTLRAILAAWLDVRPGAVAPDALASQLAELRHRERRYAGDAGQPRGPARVRLLAAVRAEVAACERLLANWLPRTPPDWLRTEVQTLAQWRAPARLARLALAWRGQRFAGDEGIFTLLEGWRRQDKHLFLWARYQERRAGLWRDWLYRNLAATLRRQYQTLVIGKINWKDLQDKPEPEVATDDGMVRRHMRVASPGRLSQLLREGFDRHRLVEVAWYTQRCCDCGRLDAFDAAAELVRVCRHCHSERDQDQRHCLNMLAPAEESVVA